ncbi:MAG TPA: CDP-alcohol phosphatidyltransferase family protein [Anaerolineales bacterium]|nr:CDP-alcohol phosphatidyltransferase family protein [Anaerolineales bacterium]
MSRLAVPPARLGSARADQITFTERLRINFGWVLNPAVELLYKLGVHPNQLTLAGVLGSLAAAMLVSQGLFSWGGLVILLTGPVDALDGALARRRGEAQDFGAFVDSVTDRYSELAVYAGLLWAAQARSDLALLMAVYFAAFGSALVSYVRARAQSLGFESKGGWFSRVERFLILSVGLLLNQPLVGVGLIAVGANLTALQRIWHVRRIAKGRE